MKLTLIGCGCGRGSLSQEAREAIRASRLLIGSERLLDEFPEAPERVSARSTQEILDALRKTDGQPAAILFSGDSGFYSGAAALLRELGNEETALLPGLSSVQVFAALLQEPWQDWRLCSAHGRDCDPVAEVCGGKAVFFLTGGKTGPAALCRELTEAGLGFLEASAGENLGLPGERVVRGTAQELAAQAFAPLSVLLVRPAPRARPRSPGFPDEAFLHAEGVPMTKQAVRALILSALAVTPEDTCWDIGTGTGSVAVELAMQARCVYSVERDEKALRLAEQNRLRFGAWNLRLLKGEAPAALAALPEPDEVFIGGSGGSLGEILRAVHSANPQARLCVSAVTLETLHEATQTMQGLGWAADVLQLAVSRSRRAGALTMMAAQNPVWLITGAGT